MHTLLSRTAPAPKATSAPRAASRHELAFARDVLRGLGEPRKSVPGRWRQDAAGIDLRGAWIALDAAHPLRLEGSLLAQTAAEIARIAGAGSRLTLADDASIALIAPLRDAIGALPAGATCGRPRRRVLYLSGSSTSSLPCEAATAARLADAARDGRHDVLVFAAALAPNDPTHADHDDSASSAEQAFNLNLLARINRELGGDFGVAGFRHHSRFDPLTQCMETHLVARVAQRVQVLGRRFEFGSGESIVIERAYRHPVARFEVLARTAGWLQSQLWVHGRGSFALHVLERAEPRDARRSAIRCEHVIET